MVILPKYAGEKPWCGCRTQEEVENYKCSSSQTGRYDSQVTQVGKMQFPEIPCSIRNSLPEFKLVVSHRVLEVISDKLWDTEL